MSEDPRFPSARIERAVVEERFLAGTGPGGQNANKVATAVQLRVDVAALSLPRYARQKLAEIAGSRLTQDGELLLVVREHRTREANREAARERLEAMISQALRRDARRIPTRASKGQRRRRVEAKKKRSQKKSMRGKVRMD